MRYSGIALALVGLCILLYSVVAGTASWETSPASEGATRGRMDLIIPIAMGVIALALGAGMYFFGGRGVIKNRNPAVRN